MSNLSQGSPAYNEWVETERSRLALSRILSALPLDSGGIREMLDRLTAENKKRRLLFARGRKEPLRKVRVRW